MDAYMVVWSCMCDCVCVRVRAITWVWMSMCKLCMHVCMPVQTLIAWNCIPMHYGCHFLGWGQIPFFGVSQVHSMLPCICCVAHGRETAVSCWCMGSLLHSIDKCENTLGFHTGWFILVIFNKFNGVDRFGSPNKKITNWPSICSSICFISFQKEPWKFGVQGYPKDLQYGVTHKCLYN